ncbi:MAG: BatD family protein [Phycisphaerae bacterium]|nr:BatD family protein [Phycisphaerae bacterium]
MRQNRWTVLGVVTAAMAWPAAAHGAQMLAQLQQDEIYYGTQTLLLVDVIDAPADGVPVVAAVEGLRIQQYGQAQLTRDLIRGTVRRQYRFLITPTTPGAFTIPLVTLTVGAETLQRGPFFLKVSEAPLKFHSLQLDPQEVLVGQSAKLIVNYQGVRPGLKAQVPTVAGLTIEAQADSPRVEIARQDALPITIHTFSVTAAALGTYRIEGITFDGVPADAVALSVRPFVVVGAQVSEDSVTVGSQTTAHVVIRGLPQSTAIRLVAPPGLKATPSSQRYRGPAGAAVFSFDLTPAEPGTFTITQFELPDGEKVTLADPITISARRGGAGGILACRGAPRSDETVVGEPFIVDYEVFFRGDLRGAGIDLSGAGFANKDYIKVEPVNDITYEGWQGQRIEVQCGDGRAVVLSGGGELNGEKEQMLRFALKITPLAAGELPLDGLRVVLALQVKEERRTAFSVFSSSRTEQYDRVAEVPPHRVIDPPGMAAPPAYRGAVGAAFTFVTQLDRTTATAMSPLTLTMKITGESVGPQFTPPPLAELAELTRDFDVSPTVGGGEVEGDTITFTQIVRPRSEAVRELPALPLAYYDYKAKKYSTAYSLPIPIEVTPGSLVGAAAMEAGAAETPTPGATQPSPGASETALLLGANYPTLGHVVVGEPLGTGAVFAILVGGPAVVLLVGVGRMVVERRRPAARLRSERNALLASLDRAHVAEHFYVHLADVLQAYLRLTFDLPPGELSQGVLRQAFDAHGVDGDLRREAEALIAACDAGRFAVGAVNPGEKDELIRRTRALLRELSRKIS